jgi:hypothetical protein
LTFLHKEESIKMGCGFWKLGGGVEGFLSSMETDQTSTTQEGTTTKDFWNHI